MTSLHPPFADVPRVRDAAVSRPASLRHSAWAERWPWLIQGTTVRRRAGSEDFDLGLFADGAGEPAVRRNWALLAAESGADVVVHSRQVHGREVLRAASVEPGRELPALGEPADGHVTDREGVLLAVSAADCVPVFLVDPGRRAVAAVHAGWRGAAAGVLERSFDVLGSAFGTAPGDLYLHCGPAICGTCYEVGPEVFEALGLPAPSAPTPIDLRAVLAERARAAGVPASAVSISTHCTRCTGSDLYSHRGGDGGRHVGFIGVRPGFPT